MNNFKLGLCMCGLVLMACSDDGSPSGPGTGGTGGSGAAQGAGSQGAGSQGAGSQGGDGGSSDGGSSQGGSSQGGSPQGGSSQGGAGQGGAGQGGGGNGGSATGGAGQGGGGGTGGSGTGGSPPMLTCQTGCEALFQCALELDSGGMQNCPALQASDQGVVVPQCVLQCANNMAVLALVNPSDCEGTINTLSTLSPQFAALCQNGP